MKQFLSARAHVLIPTHEQHHFNSCWGIQGNSVDSGNAVMSGFIETATDWGLSTILPDTGSENPRFMVQSVGLDEKKFIAFSTT